MTYLCIYENICAKYSTVIHRLMIHPICNNCFYNFLQLFILKKIMTIHLKSTRTYFQNMKFIEWFLSEIQVKHWCIIGWEYITAQYDLAVAHPKVIHSAWKFIGRIIQYITMSLSIYFLIRMFMCQVIWVYHWVVVYHWPVDDCMLVLRVSCQF